MMDLNENENSVNGIREVPITKTTELIIKSYEIICLDLKNCEYASSYSLGNWSKLDLIFRNTMNF